MKGTTKAFLILICISLSILSMAVLAPAEPFTIKESTVYDIVDNTVYVTIKENLGKDQIIDISNIFTDDSLTRKIQYSDVLLWQAYTADVYGYYNETIRCDKVNEKTCWNETDTKTGKNDTQVCIDVPQCLDKNGKAIYCDYLVNDECTAAKHGVTGNEQKYDYKPVSSMKSKSTISSKIEQKQEGIVLPKNSEIKLKYTYSHPIAYGISVPTKSNKYSIKVESSDKADSSLLDPAWFNTSWSYSKKLTITENNATTLTNYNVNITIDTATLISAGKLQADCDDLRFTDVTNTTELDYYLDSNCNTASTLVWLEVPTLTASSATVVYMYYGNSGASRGSTSNAFSDWDLVYLCNEATGTAIADASPINDSGSMTNGYWETVNPKFGNAACAANNTNGAQYITYFDVFDARDAASTTIEGWFYITARENSWDAWTHGGNDDENVISLVNNADGTLYINGLPAPPYWGTISLSTWYKITITANADTDTVSVYIDGILQRTSTSWTKILNIALGSRIFNNVDRNTLNGNGIVDYFRIAINKTITPVSLEPTYVFGSEEVGDTTPPQVVLIAPTNTTFGSTNITLTYTSWDSSGVSSCLYELNNVNSSVITGCLNTTFTATANGNKIKVWSNDISNNWNQSATVYFTSDTTPPTILLNYPLNLTYAGNSMTVQYTAWSKYGISTCFIELDNSNYTNPSIICDNMTFGSLYMTEGSHHFKVYANNTLGIWNVSSTVYFTMDNTNPTVSLTTPANSTYGTNVSLAYTRYDANGISSCLYELNNVNTTISGCLNTTLTGASGTNKLKLWVNDTAGLWGVSSTVYFTVDTTQPTISISLPANTTYTTANSTLTYTAWDANGVSSCLYELNGASNVTLTGCWNSTFLASEGGNTIKLFSSDTFGNFGQDDVSFWYYIAPPPVLTVSAYDENNPTDRMRDVKITFTNSTHATAWNHTFGWVNLPNETFGGSYSALTPVYEINFSSIDSLRGADAQLNITLGASMSGSCTLTMMKNGLFYDTIDFPNNEWTYYNFTTDTTVTYGDDMILWVNTGDCTINQTTIRNLTVTPADYTLLMTQVQSGYNTITAEKLGYGDRKYYLNITGDADAALPIYMLDLSSGHSVSWTVLASDSAGNILPSSGVLVTARRNLGGWKTIDQETTDDSGTASLWLDYESYEMTFSKAGCTNVTKTITATESSYQQSLSCAVISNLTFDYEFRDITFNITPDAFYTNTTNIIFEIKSWNSTLQYYGFNVTWNGTVIYSGYGTSITGGILNATVNLTNATGTFVKMDIWFKTGNFTEMKFTLYRAVGNPYTVGGAESWLRNIANYLGLPARMIVALFLSILLIAGFGRYSGFGAGIIVLIFLGILTFVGWFEGFPMWLPTYTVFIMATFGIYMLRGER